MTIQVRGVLHCSSSLFSYRSMLVSILERWSSAARRDRRWLRSGTTRAWGSSSSPWITWNNIEPHGDSYRISVTQHNTHV